MDKKIVYCVQVCHSIDNYTIVYDQTTLFDTYEKAYEYCKTTIEEDYEYGVINDFIKDIYQSYEYDKWDDELPVKRGDDLYRIIDDYDVVFVIDTMTVH